MENKNIGSEFDKIVLETNETQKPNFLNFIIVAINEIGNKTVIKPFKAVDWKKNIKKLLKLNDSDFDTMNLTNFNWVQKLTERGYFVDLVDNNERVEIYLKGETKEQFILNDWKEKLNLISDKATVETIVNADAFIQHLFLTCYSKKEMVSLDKETKMQDFMKANADYISSLRQIEDNFKEEFINNYNVTDERATKILNIAKKYIGSAGYSFIEEMAVDILSLSDIDSRIVIADVET
jgi:hypothetical protein